MTIPTHTLTDMAVVLGRAGSAGSAGPNYSLMLWTAARIALVGAVVVLPLRKVK